MNNPAFRSLRYPVALLLLGGAFLLPSFSSAASPAPHALADNAAPLPLKATFRKAKKKADEDAAGYTLRLRNTSDKAVSVSATIIVSVPVHNNPKVREESAHEIAAGKSWTIKGLAAQDKVTVKADGFAPLELTVP
ncbi:MAG TPA: hypothetical protein VHE13_18315 [Opitutus sp.]|nr:hypothetical protein [Opitutus sp.]